MSIYILICSLDLLYANLQTSRRTLRATSDNERQSMARFEGSLGGREDLRYESLREK